MMRAGIFVLAIFLAGCRNPVNEMAILPLAPEAIEDSIRSNFPGALPGPVYADSLIGYLGEHYAIQPNEMLLGASTCVDDIIYTKNFKVHSEIKGPFHLGGLAGLPFTGISGLNAFGHHIPEGGTMILLIEPHIGISEKKGWGFILRHQQDSPSSCCGALMGTLAQLSNGTLTDSATVEDYQGAQIAKLALKHKDEILSAPIPIIRLTRIVSLEAEKQIRKHILDLDLKHIRYIVTITGVLIDTDYAYTDYQFIEHFSVYDTRSGKFVEEQRNDRSGGNPQ